MHESATFKHYDADDQVTNVMRTSSSLGGNDVHCRISYIAINAEGLVDKLNFY